jgi:asparagine synthase (glutamine-hydrolysing)
MQILIDAHEAGTRDNSVPIWTLFMFEAFLKRAQQ